MGGVMATLRNLPTPRKRCGIGLRAAHVAEVIATHPDIAWFEVHAENHMRGGQAIRDLETIRNDYPVSLHGVGLSLGGATRVDRRHLARLRDLAGRIEPCLVSEHLSWTGTGGVYLNELLPLPLTEEALAMVTRNVLDVQDFLKRPILIENPSAYLRFAASAIPEAEFLAALVDRTDCGLLCDVNNIHVSCTNLGGDPFAWIASLPAHAVAELHLAGHCANVCDDAVLLIDDHGAPVAQAVWAMFKFAASRFPAAAALIEWDTNIPALAVLMDEAAKADHWSVAGHEMFDHAAA